MSKYIGKFKKVGLRAGLTVAVLVGLPLAIFCLVVLAELMFVYPGVTAAGVLGILFTYLFVRLYKDIDYEMTRRGL